MNFHHLIAKLQQAQHYNSHVIKVLINRLHGSSFFARSVNFTLWGLFHAVRVFRMCRFLLRGKVNPPPAVPEISAPWQMPLSIFSRTTLGNRVLIVAELSLIQCKKYRVTQKVELLSLFDYRATILPWSDYKGCRNALQTHGIVIFYRTPAIPELIKLANEARRLGVVSLFDIDDLVFDLEEYRRNTNIEKLSKQEIAALMKGASLYRDMLQLTDHAIASTEVIRERMQPLCRGKVFVLENCVDTHILKLADGKHPPRDKDIIIGYGSGTRTHDADFMVAVPALLQILDIYTNVYLAIYGYLELPSDFSRFSERIVRVPFLAVDDYYLSLARFSINLTPLEESVFNDAKSNIKFLEASVFGVPSICSPAAALRKVIRHGENGFLASTTQEWFSVLSHLIENPELRHRIGTTAKKDVLQRYLPEIIAERQFRPILDYTLPPGKEKKIRILMVNVLFAPTSFGGATIVAEQLAFELSRMRDVEICVFTGSFHPGLSAYEVARYEWNNIPIITIGLPPNLDRTADYDNPEMSLRFEEVLDAVRPDVVHFHSIQILSSALAEVCLRTNTPYVITLHDAWWLCERQFMIRSDGNYCAQQGISLNVCNSCTPDSAFTHHRFYHLWQIMENAALLLAPSEFQRNLYIHSGIAPNHIKVNKNGVLPPAQRYAQTRSSNHITFAFLGGRAVHKGYFFLREVFASIRESNYTLRLVDIESKFGASQMPLDSWELAGKLEIVSPFKQDEVDIFFNNIDVLLFPSQWKESFGLTVREAMARDVWVIATDCGGPMEDIINGENGEIVTMGDVDAFRSTVVKLLQNPARIANYRNPHATEIRYFQQQATELLDILREVSCHSAKK